MLRCFITLLFSLSVFSSIHAATLRSSAFNSQIFCWIEGDCQGLVEANSYGAAAQRLNDVLLSAKKSVDVAIFGVRKQDWFIQSLKDLQKKGVRIRVVTDQKTGAHGEWDIPSNFIYSDIDKLVDAIGEKNVQVDLNKDGSVRTGSFMHNKFVVVDNKKVWFGSTNISHTEIGSEYNANASVLLESSQIAKIFTLEFEQMFVDKKFSIHKSRHNQQTVEFDNGKADVFFSPQDNIIDNGIVPLIKKAKKSIDVGIFFLTSTIVAEALADAAKKGVKVRIIHDALAERHPYSVTDIARRGGAEVRVENWGGKMHMKTMVVDKRHSLIGSMNFSNAGDSSNDESVVILWDHFPISTELHMYFEKMWASLDGVATSPRAESFESINSCYDGIDNNHSGRIDDCWR